MKHFWKNFTLYEIFSLNFFLRKPFGVEAVFSSLQKFCILLRNRLKRNFEWNTKKVKKFGFAKNLKFSQNDFSFLLQTLIGYKGKQEIFFDLSVHPFI